MPAGSNEVSKKRVEELIRRQNVNAVDNYNGRTALHWAVENGSFSLWTINNFKILIESIWHFRWQGNCEFVDSKWCKCQLYRQFGRNTTTYCCYQRCIYEFIYLFIYLWPNLFLTYIEDIVEILNMIIVHFIYADDEEIADSLVRYGANIDYEGIFKTTPLHLAAWNGNN